MIILLSRSWKPGKKWMVEFLDGQKVHFGVEGYEDYTTHNNETRKNSYLKRHRAENLGFGTIRKASFWARWLLWNKKTFKENIEDIFNRFGIVVLVKDYF